MGLKINQQPVQTTDACDYGAGAFKDNSFDFTATANPTNVRFEFLVGNTDAVVKIDNGMSIIFWGPFFLSPSSGSLCEMPDGFWRKGVLSCPFELSLFPENPSRR